VLKELRGGLVVNFFGVFLMQHFALPDVEAALELPSQVLCEGNLILFKTAESEDVDAPWKFAGIASDESEDVDGDKILKKSIDLTYARERGFVNWDHSRDPSNQLGFLTKAILVTDKNKEKLAEELGMPLAGTASVYVEGELYKNVKKAAEVWDIMKSTPSGVSGLGISLDGVIARDRLTSNIVKAFVRGVAITPVPAHPKTLLRLRKSLQGYAMMEDSGLPPELPAEIAAIVVDELKKHLSIESQTKIKLNDDEAILWLLKKRPRFTYDIAKKVLQFTKENARGVAT